MKIKSCYDNFDIDLKKDKPLKMYYKGILLDPDLMIYYATRPYVPKDKFLHFIESSSDINKVECCEHIPLNLVIQIINLDTIYEGYSNVEHPLTRWYLMHTNNVKGVYRLLTTCQEPQETIINVVKSLSNKEHIKSHKIEFFI